MLLSSTCLPQHKINRLDSSCCSSVQEGKEFQWQNPENQVVHTCPYSLKMASSVLYNFALASWNISRKNEDVCMYVLCTHHVHATYCTCGGCMCVVHIDRYHWSYDTSWSICLSFSFIFYQQTFSESPSVETSSHAASIVSSNASIYWGCRRMSV